MKYAVLFTVLVSVMALGVTVAYAVRDNNNNTTTIAVDEKAGTIRFLAAGKEVATINAAGLHVAGDIEYTGMMADTGSAVQP